MTSVWIITNDNTYLNAEKIQNLYPWHDAYSSNKNIHADIGYDYRESIYCGMKNYTYESIIKHIIRWIYKANILASERNEPIFLDFNKNFDNPIVED